MYRFLGLLCFFFSTCYAQSSHDGIQTGASQIPELLKRIDGRRVGLMVNQTSVLHGGTHLVDTLLSKNVKIKVIFAPEHGFRGKKGAGEKINSSVDTKTGLPIASLYGKTKKPTADMLKDVDLLIFDIQDVGLRFYTYISSMHYLMESAAEQQKPILILDRPNPNGRFVEGVVLDPTFKSFVGMHPVPIFHGMTVGEYAQMINGQKWLKNQVMAELSVLKMKNYNHQMPYHLPIKPSPNLPNDQAIKLYGSLCLFEGTVVSIGRGTSFPFQVVGYPGNTKGDFSFTPVKIEGVAKYPKFENQNCQGWDLRKSNFKGGLNLKWLLKTYKSYPKKDQFFKPFFNKLAGTEQLMAQIKSGKTETQIKKSWQKDLDKFKAMRQQYLLYP